MSLETTISPYHRRSSELYRNAIANTVHTLITSNLEYDFGLGSEASTKNIDCRGLYENEYKNALCDYIIYKSKALTFPNTYTVVGVEHFKIIGELYCCLEILGIDV